VRRFALPRPTGAQWVLLAALGLWLAVTLPWVAGERILVLRDVVYTHRHFKWFGAAELAAGHIPAINPTWGIGQPFRGNPNALPFYPGNLLYLLLPFEAAFHLHYALHWLLAFLGMRKLAGELGQSEPARLLAAIAWAGSGYVLSLLSFYNILAVVAWAPFVLWGLVRGDRRGVAWGGLACGLMLLGGEPVTAALVGVAMALVALERHGLRRGLVRLAAVGALGVLLALPQLVATARVLPFSFRAVHGIEPDEAAWQSLHPARLLELALPLPWGWPSDYARHGYWSKVVTPDIPYVYSIHLGVVAFALALVGACRRRAWAALAGGALALAWAGGLSPPVTAAVTRGLFRYPQKLAVLFTLAAALLAGWGLERALERPRVARALALAGALAAALALAFWLAFPRVVELFRVHLAEGGKEVLASTHAAQWMIDLALAALLLGAAAWALARRRAALVVAIELAGLLQLAPMLVSDDAAFYRRPSPLLASVDAPRTVVPVPAHEPEWEPRIPFPLEAVNPIGQARLAWLQLEAPFGVQRGLSYPIAPDLEGINTPLEFFLYRNLQLADWSERVPWLARLGVGWVVRFAALPAAPGLERVSEAELYGVEHELDRVPDPAPPLAWPDAVEVAPNPLLAFPAVAHGRVPPGTAVASRPVAHHPGGRLSLVERTSDRWVFDVDSEGGLAVVQTAWHPIWRARLEDGRAVPTQAVDVMLTGVDVPPGHHRVTLEVSSWPETTAGVVALLAALTAALVGWRARP
jgi:hypothetical protein